MTLEDYSESDYNISGSAEKQWGIAPNSAAVFLSLGISRTHTAIWLCVCGCASQFFSAACSAQKARWWRCC